ncbi:adhesin biosynthesis transcription regulatory family protein [Escherichia coli]|nr:transcriptional regulator [Escherichia coli]EFN9654893.1 transcriptional regulator [Escherichia coli]EIE2933746.1 adhesin biosynthesis transcription regulatory family protein [Escherichia coli]EKA4295462.1 adhesin biosynthesis transcription regulatory family protein [Escherichia coli]ELX9910935.1 adhesin biosynthesis transcription regulatory family protein [Escherichia coli]
MAHHEVISRAGNAFLLNIRESVLLPGSMSEMHFFLLIGISSIHSDRVILAMKDYLVGGHSRKEVCEKYQMNNGYFSTTLGRLIRLNALAARLAPYYTDEASAYRRSSSYE